MGEWDVVNEGLYNSTRIECTGALPAYNGQYRLNPAPPSQLTVARVLGDGESIEPDAKS